MEGITPVVYQYHEDESRPIDLDFYAPKDYSPSTISYQTAIVYHGGGLTVGNKRQWIPLSVMNLLSQQKWILISPDYHLLPESTTADIHGDVVALEHWLLLHHNETGIDLDRICIIGASAGSFVSILTCTSWKSIGPKAFLNIYGMVNPMGTEYNTKKDWDNDYMILGLVPVSSLNPDKYKKFLVPGRRRIWDDRDDIEGLEDRSGFFWYLKKEGKVRALVDGTLTKPSAAAEMVNPMDLLTEQFPPTISIHGEKDSIVPVHDSEVFTAKLKTFGVETRLLVAPGAEHGLQPEAEFLYYFEQGVAFLEKSVK